MAKLHTKTLSRNRLTLEHLEDRIAPANGQLFVQTGEWSIVTDSGETILVRNSDSGENVQILANGAPVETEIVGGTIGGLDSTFVVPQTIIRKLSILGDGGDNQITVTAEFAGGSGDGQDLNIQGGGGNDVITITTNHPGTISGGPGDDVIRSNSEFGMQLNGDAGNDTLTGGIGNDSLDGGTGDDTYKISEGADTVTDAEGSEDVLDFSELSAVDVDFSVDGPLSHGVGSIDLQGQMEVVIGTDGDDRFKAPKVGKLRIEGRDGDNIFETTSNNLEDKVTFVGGKNEDTFIFPTNSAALIVDDIGIRILDFSKLPNGIGAFVNFQFEVNRLGPKTVGGFIVGGSMIPNIETTFLGGFHKIIGSPNNDQFTGSSFDLFGTSINGGDGDDIIEGNDVFGDTLVGGNGNDTLKYAEIDRDLGLRIDLFGAQVISRTDNRIDEVTGFENVIGSEFGDEIIGTGGDNILDGGGGDDIISGLFGNDTLIGGTGSDTYRFGNLNGPEEVFIREDFSDSPNDTLDFAANFADASVGGPAATELVVALSSPTFIASNNGVSGKRIIRALDGTSAEIENVIGTPDNDTIIGNSLNNTLDGRGGKDTIQGGSGTDNLIGGEDEDTLSYENSEVSVTVNLVTQLAVDENGDKDTITEFENIIGSNFNDTLIGDNQPNDIFGGDGDDILDGGKGDAQLLDGEEGEDTVTYERSDVGVDVDLIIERGDRGAERDSLVGIEHVIGSPFADELIGDSNDNFLDGGDGADVFDDMSGSDTMSGGSGNDLFVFSFDSQEQSQYVVLEIGTGIDTLDFQFIDGDLHVDLLGLSAANSLGFEIAQHKSFSVLFNGIGGATIENVKGGFGNDLIFGNDEDNLLLGVDGNDQLHGRDGDDKLFGDIELDSSPTAFPGDDTLKGGPGKDLLSGDEGDDTLISIDGEPDILIGGKGSDTPIPDGADTLQDFSVDVAILDHQDSADPILLGANVEYQLKVENKKTTPEIDTAIQVSLVGGMTGAISGQPYNEDVGELFINPFTNLPTNVRTLPAGASQTFNPIATGTGIINGIGFNSVVSFADSRERDEDLTNNKDTETTKVEADFTFTPGNPSAPGGGTGVVSQSPSGTTGFQESRVQTNNAQHTIDETGFVGFTGTPDLAENVVSTNFSNALIGDPFLVNVTPDGQAGNGDSRDPKISEDGNTVAFTARSNNLHPLDDSFLEDIFVRNMTTGEIELITVDSTGSGGANVDGSTPLAVSPNGNFVVFSSPAGNLVDGVTDLNGGTAGDLFVHNRTTGETKLITKSLDGTSTANTGFAFVGSSPNVDIADDGKVVFTSTATNLVANSDTNNVADVFLWDPVTETITLITVTPDGSAGAGTSRGTTFAADNPRITRDGTKIFFESTAPDLANNQTDGNNDESSPRNRVDVFVRDLATGTTSYVSVNADGTGGGNGVSRDFDVTPDGSTVVFESSATDLGAPGIGSSFEQVFARDMITGTIQSLSLSVSGSASFGSSENPVIDNNSRFVAFQSSAENLIALDGNFDEDIFVFDLQTNERTVVSVTPTGNTANGDSTDPLISGDGSIVVFNSKASNISDTILDENNGTDIFVSDLHSFDGGVGGTGLTFNAPTEKAANLLLIRDEDNVQLIDRDTNEVLDEIAVDGLDFIRINVDPDEDAPEDADQLIVDLSGGPILPTQGIEYNAALGGFDFFAVAGATFDSGFYTFTDPGAVNMGLFQDDTALSITVNGAGFINDAATVLERTVQSLLPGNVSMNMKRINEFAMQLTSDGDTFFPSMTIQTFDSDLTVIGGDGNDTIIAESVSNNLASLTLAGGLGNDVLDASTISETILVDGPGDDQLFGGFGPTTFVLTPGSDDIVNDVGGEDILDFSQALNFVSQFDPDLLNVPQLVDGIYTVQLNAPIEHLIGTRGPDTITVDPLNIERILEGGDGIDTLVVPNFGLASVNDDGVISVPGFADLFADDFEIIDIGAPVGIDDTYNVDEDSILTVGVDVGVLTNDVDVDPLTVSVDVGPSNGTLALNDDGSFSYEPNADFFGTDAFTYIVSDGGLSSKATVSIIVASIEDDPIAVDVPIQTDEDVPVTFDVLPIATDVDGDDVFLVQVAEPTNGVVDFDINGIITYTPNENTFGTDQFQYTITDENGNAATANVIVEVDSVNDIPIAAADSATTAEDTVVVIDVLDNDTDVENDTLTPRVIIDPAFGTTEINPDGSITYTPDDNFHGNDSFTYRVNDGSDDSNTTTVNIVVTPVNDAPSAIDDVAETTEKTAIILNVLANDFDIDGDVPQIQSIQEPQNGTVRDNLDGTITYTPNAGFTGEDSFQYTIVDEFGEAATAVVRVTVVADEEEDELVLIIDGSDTRDFIFVFLNRGKLSVITSLGSSFRSARQTIAPPTNKVIIHGNGGNEFFDQIHHGLAVAVRLVNLNHSEFRVVTA